MLSIFKVLSLEIPISSGSPKLSLFFLISIPNPCLILSFILTGSFPLISLPPKIASAAASCAALSS